MGSNTVILNLDDFASDYKRNALNWLFDFKSQYPDFKITLFSIGRFCSIEFLQSIKKLKWIQLAGHGFTHSSNSECLKWDEDKWKTYLNVYEQLGYKHLFKAPNYQMNKLGYEMLKKNGWWIACRKYQIKDLPKGMKYYCFETTPGGVTGHTWLMEAHKKEGKFDWDKDTKFDFCSQHLEVK